MCVAGLLPGLSSFAQAPTPRSQPLAPPTKPRAVLPLVPVSSQAGLGVDEQIFSDRTAMLTAIDRSLRYLQSGDAVAAYRKYPVPGVTRDRVRRSLERFRVLVQQARSPADLQAAVAREFVFYQASGKDGHGAVGFTGYFEPVHVASRVPTQEFRYPIYRLPSDFDRWKKPHPTREQLEGIDGLQSGKTRLKGAEFVWLRDRLEAFLVQVQGSARLKLTDGSTMTIGYAGHTDYPYVGIGRELVKAGKLTLEELTLPRLVQYFQANPAELNVYLPRNQRFVFFQETGGAPATGSLGAAVTAARSIATDKSVFPPGALALIHTRLPLPNGTGQLEQHLVSRYVLDQDTGGAIKGAGRVDVFMGTGQAAADRAGLINSTGALYYLLLK